MVAPAHDPIARSSQASSNLAGFDGVRYGLRVGDDGAREARRGHGPDRREQGFGPEVKRRIILGTYALSSGYYEAYYGQAQKVRTLISRDFSAAFDGVDVLVSPTTPTVAFPLGARVDDPVAMYAADLCTLPASLAGVPAISVPCGLSEGLPVGFQIMAPALADDRCYQVAAALEAALPPTAATAASSTSSRPTERRAQGRLGPHRVRRPGRHRRSGSSPAGPVFAVFIVLGVLTGIGALVSGRTAPKEGPTP